MTVLESDANGADAAGDPLRDGMDLVQRGALSGEGTCDFIDQDDARKPSARVSPRREPYAIQRTCDPRSRPESCLQQHHRRPRET
jgi:hypothetical protein